ncbi:hypothetical protein L9Z41_03465 [Leptospira noguchii]|uniref:LIC13305 family lipoprotein n=1 Tax=Leptospira noguchii TaxID=28182 RepID=UPI001F070DEA|nr:hypothetical protein [Leptospira noguchii]MCH1911650.1 hypothetical protein [Leptospira noguchii]MCH1914733.1 hypothetical protein [Leptospira noguchii]UOG64661.1 hypothetical protein MAL04_03570 [Leptospira noguchii]
MYVYRKNLISFSINASKFILSFLILISLISSCEKKDDSEVDLLLTLTALQPPDQASNYDRDVQIITRTTQGFPINCDVDYTEEDLDYYVGMLKAEIARYPRGYWIKAGTESVTLCRNLKALGVYAAGTTGFTGSMFLDVRDRIASFDSIIFDQGTGTWINYLDTDYGYASDPRGTIHHELTHSVDHHVPGFITFFDPEWGKLNYPGFQYGNSYDPKNPPVEIFHNMNPVPGFVSYYATERHIEDRAEIGRVIMARPSTYNRLVQICRTDPIVAAKVRKTVSEWKQFWPYPGAENTEWKVRITQAERDCN